MKINLLLILAVTLCLCSCQSTSTVPLNAEQYNSREVITESLFSDKNSTISEENIQRLLDGEIQIPDTVRVAIYKYGGSSLRTYFSYYGTDEEYLKLQQNYIDTLVAQLSVVPKVAKVILVPTIMASSSANITQLRETAVRLQADLLFIFNLNSDIYYKYKAFQRNEAKAFATCEALLMDTRTGVIPHSSVITSEKVVFKSSADLSNEETRKRAENGAIILSLVETGRRAARFLNEE